MENEIFMPNLRVGPLVRAISATSVVIWAEFDQPCSVTLSARLDAAPEQPSLQVTTRTISIGGHHYAAPQLLGLAPARWYNYRLATSALDGAETKQLTNTPDTVVPMLQCFRTLEDKIEDEVEDEVEARDKKPLRVLYGSCRQLDRPEQ